jgi:hypothetical protein
MYRGFNLKTTSFKKSDFHETHKIGNSIYQNNLQSIYKTLNSYLSEEGVLDGDKIQDDWFSNIDADIFLSHSHNDLEEAICFAGWVKRTFNLKVFIDSCVWGNSADLLKEIDKVYCTNGSSNSYDYEQRNFSTSHVHMMLSTSLTKMIDKCECFVFLNTKNSISNLTSKEVIETKTKSPWLYSELETSRMIRKKIDRESLILEKSIDGYKSRMYSNMEIDYTAPLGHLEDINNTILTAWKNSNEKIHDKTHPLDLLYKLVPTEKIFIYG